MLASDVQWPEYALQDSRLFLTVALVNFVAGAVLAVATTIVVASSLTKIILLSII